LSQPPGYSDVYGDYYGAEYQTTSNPTLAVYAPAPPITPYNSYRFITTNILTGRVLSDSLPIIATSASRQINAVGEFDGALALTDLAWSEMGGGGGQGFGSNYQVSQWVNAITPWKSVLWVLQNEVPIWNGPITAWNPTTSLDGTLEFQAGTMEAMFQHRLVSDDLSWTNLDVFEIFRQELLYALAKTPNGNIAGSGRYANQSGIVDSVQYSGVLASVTESSTLKAVYDAWNDLVNNYGLEYALSPALSDDGSLYTLVQLGLPLLGRAQSTTKLQMVYPSYDMIDYAWQAIATSPANTIWVTGTGGTNNQTTYLSQLPNGQDATELSEGFPLLEDSFAVEGNVTSQDQINSLANGLLPGTTITSSLTPMFTLGPQATPQLNQTQLGDQILVAVSSPQYPVNPNTGAPGMQATFRISGWSLTFPGAQQQEQVQYTLGAGTAAQLEGGLWGGFVDFGGFGSLEGTFG
jgi:hypothetical protein